MTKDYLAALGGKLSGGQLINVCENWSSIRSPNYFLKEAKKCYKISLTQVMFRGRFFFFSLLLFVGLGSVGEKTMEKRVLFIFLHFGWKDKMYSEVGE